MPELGATEGELWGRPIVALCCSKMHSTMQELARLLLDGSVICLPLPPEADSARQLDTVLGRIQKAAETSDVDVRRIWSRIDLITGTSGTTTGTGKLVGLTAAALTTSARATWQYLLEGSSERTATWVLALPAHHIAGLQVVFRAATGTHLGVRLTESNLEILGTDDFLPDFIKTTKRAQSSTQTLFTSLVPTQLHRVLSDEAATQAAAAYTRILVGGGPTDPNLLDRARNAGLNVATTYGASETAGGCFYDGRPIPSDPPPAAHISEDGTVGLTTPTLFEGYLSGETGPIRTDHGLMWQTKDLAHLDDGRLVIDGRSDRVIISGGIKVFPQQVEQSLRDLGAEHALVVGMPSEEWGQRVCALATLPKGVAVPTLDHAREYVRNALGAAAAPARILWVDEIPTQGISKPDYQRAQQMLTDAGYELTE